MLNYILLWSDFYRYFNKICDWKTNKNCGVLIKIHPYTSKQWISDKVQLHYLMYCKYFYIHQIHINLKRETGFKYATCVKTH